MRRAPEIDTVAKTKNSFYLFFNSLKVNMKKCFLFIIVVLFFTLFLTNLITAQTESSGFVKVNNCKLEIDNKPYYFTGANLWYGCYLGSTGTTGDRPRLIRELDLLKSCGVNHFRVLGASEDSYMKKALKPPIQKAPGEYDEQLLQGLDFLLDELAKRDMKAVIFLNNFWEWTGGMSQYNYWADSSSYVDLYTTQNWNAFMNYSASFYSNKKANDLFRKYVSMLINRKNSINGKLYCQDPTIMAWQLANEPRPGDKPQGLAVTSLYYKWIDETAMFIHSADTNHLVTTGSEGTMGSLDSASIYLKAHASKYIDFITFHLWPKNWAWFNAKRAAETYPSTEAKAIAYIKEHIDFARKLNKPTIMEEFGLPRDNEEYNADSSTSIRDAYFRTIYQTIYNCAAAGDPICGTDFWAWGGEGRGQNADNFWQPGDPFTGDPPQEPQGLNSIFDTDKTTLEVIKAHALRFSQIGE